MPINFANPAGIEFMIMQSSAEADKIIDWFYEMAAAGEEDVDYSTDGLLEEDAERIDEAYSLLFG